MNEPKILFFRSIKQPPDAGIAAALRDAAARRWRAGEFNGGEATRRPVMLRVK